MNKKLWLATGLLVTLSLGTALAQDTKPQPPKMSPAQQAEMEAMMKAMTPGPAHKAMDGMAGTFDTRISMWPQPGMPPTVNTGTSETHWIMGNRYLEQQFNGNFMGMPFTGLGHTGYDNVKKQYWSTWMDNFSTGVMESTGSVSADGRSWGFTGTTADPMTGKDARSDTKITVADPDHYTMEMWGPAPDGKMFKMMEIAYSRKK
ncbi:MAG: hypothetical protein JWN02_847 [Acidobacteria bacterium]|nr:hypothetical protein [Acidobacteriota bacterium]